MSIVEALQNKIGIRVSYGNRWLVWNITRRTWIVYGREYAQKKTRTFVETEDEALAIRHLLCQEEW